MSKKSFFLRNVATTVACLAVFTLFWGCAKDKDKAPESTRTVTGQIVNLDNRKIMEIGFGFDNETGLTVPCTNGNFTIDLPETIDNSLLVDFREGVSNTVQLSDNGLRITIGTKFYAAGNAVECELELRSADNSVVAYLIYADRNCVISGTHSGEWDESTTLDLTLQKGWNRIYGYINDATYIQLATTSKPNVELKWYLWEYPMEAKAHLPKQYSDKKLKS